MDVKKNRNNAGTTPLASFRAIGVQAGEIVPPNARALFVLLIPSRTKRTQANLENRDSPSDVLGFSAWDSASRRVPKVPISFGSGAGKDWIAPDRTGNTRAGKLLACFALAPKSLNFKGLLQQKESCWRREEDLELALRLRPYSPRLLSGPRLSRVEPFA
jgi:hypothetical protein